MGTIIRIGCRGVKGVQISDAQEKYLHIVADIFPCPSKIWTHVTPRQPVQIIIPMAGYTTNDLGDNIEGFQMVMEVLSAPAGQVGITLYQPPVGHTHGRARYTDGHTHQSGTRWQHTHGGSIHTVGGHTQVTIYTRRRHVCNYLK